MNPQLRQISTEINDATARARNVVENLHAGLAGRRPHPSSWSVEECIAHLTMTTDAFLAVIRPAIDRARNQQLLDAGTTFGMGLSARLLAWWLEPPYRTKSKTSAAFVPGSEQSARALPDFLDRQSRLLDLIAEADGLALDRIQIASPFAPRMKYNVYAAVRLIAVHQRRHLWQAEHVARRLLAVQAGGSANCE